MDQTRGTGNPPTAGAGGIHRPSSIVPPTTVTGSVANRVRAMNSGGGGGGGVGVGGTGTGGGGGNPYSRGYLRSSTDGSTANPSGGTAATTTAATSNTSNTGTAAAPPPPPPPPPQSVEIDASTSPYAAPAGRKTNHNNNNKANGNKAKVPLHRGYTPARTNLQGNPTARTLAELRGTGLNGSGTSSANNASAASNANATSDPNDARTTPQQGNTTRAAPPNVDVDVVVRADPSSQQGALSPASALSPSSAGGPAAAATYRTPTYQAGPGGGGAVDYRRGGLETPILDHPPPGATTSGGSARGPNGEGATTSSRSAVRSSPPDGGGDDPRCASPDASILGISPNATQHPTQLPRPRAESPTKALQSQLSAHLTDLQNSQSTTLDSAFRLLLTQVTAQGKQINELSHNQTRYVQTQNGIRQTQDDVRSEQEGVREEIDLVYERWSDLNGVVRNLERKTETLGAGMDTVAKEVDCIERIEREVGGGLDGLRGAVDKLNTELAGVRQGLEVGREDGSRLRQVVGEVETKVVGVEGALSKVTTKLQSETELNATKMIDLGKMLVDQMEQMELLVKHNEESASQVDGLRSTIDTVVRSNDALFNQLKDRLESLDRDWIEDKANTVQLVQALQRAQVEQKAEHEAALESVRVETRSELGLEFEERIRQSREESRIEMEQSRSAAERNQAETLAALEATLAAKFEDRFRAHQTQTVQSLAQTDDAIVERISVHETKTAQLIDTLTTATETKLASLQTQADQSLTQSNDALAQSNQSVTHLQNQLEAQRQSDATVINSRFDDITSSLPDFESMVTAMDVRSVRDDLGGRVGRLQDRQDQLEGKLDGTANELREEMGALNVEVTDQLTEGRSKANDAVRDGNTVVREELRGEITQLGNQVGAMSSAVTELSQLGLQSVPTELIKLKEEMVGVTTTVHGLTDDLVKFKEVTDSTVINGPDGLSGLKVGIDTLRSDMDAVKRSVSADVETVEGAMKERDVSVDALYGELKEELDGLAKTNGTRDDVIGRFGRDLEGLRLLDVERAKKEAQDDGQMTELVGKVDALQGQVEEMRSGKDHEESQRQARDVVSETELGKTREELVKIGQTVADLRKLDDERSAQLVDLRAKSDCVGADSRMESTRTELEGLKSELVNLTDLIRTHGERRDGELSRVEQDLDVLRRMNDERKAEVDELRRYTSEVEQAEFVGVREELGSVKGEIDELKRRVTATADVAEVDSSMSREELDDVKAHWKVELDGVRREVDELRQGSSAQLAEVGGIRREVEGLRVREKTRDLQTSRAVASAAPTPERGLPPASMERGLSPASMDRGLPPASLDRGLPPSSMVRGLPPAPMERGLPVAGASPAKRRQEPVVPTVVARSCISLPAAPVHEEEGEEEEDQATISSTSRIGIDPNNSFNANKRQGGPEEPTDQIAMALDGLRKLQESLLQERAKAAEVEGNTHAAGVSSTHSVRSAQGGGSPLSSPGRRGVEERLAARRAARSTGSADSSPTKVQQLQMQKEQIEKKYHDQQQQPVAPATSATGEDHQDEEQSTAQRRSVAAPIDAPDAPDAPQGDTENVVLTEQLRLARHEIGDSLMSYGTPTDTGNRKTAEAADAPSSASSGGSKVSKVSDITPVRRAREEVANLSNDLRGWEEDLAVDHTPIASPDASPVRAEVDYSMNDVPYTPAEINRTRAAAAAAREEAIALTNPDDSITFSAASDAGVVVSPDRANVGAAGYTPMATWQRDAVDGMARRRLQGGGDDEDDAPRGAPNLEENRHPVDTPLPDPTPNVSRSRTLAFRDMVSRGSFERKQQQLSQEQEVTPYQGAPTPAKPRAVGNTAPTPAKVSTPAKPLGEGRDIYNDASQGDGENHGVTQAPDPPSEESSVVDDDEQQRRVVHDPPDDLGASVAVLGQHQLQQLRQQQDRSKPAAEPAPTHISVAAPSAEAEQPAQAPVPAPAAQTQAPVPAPVAVPAQAQAPAPVAVVAPASAPACAPAPAPASTPPATAEADLSRASQPDDEARAAAASRSPGPTSTQHEQSVSDATATRKNTVVFKETTSVRELKSRYQFCTPSTASLADTGAAKEETSFTARELAVEVVARSHDEEVPLPPPLHTPPPTVAPPQAGPGQEKQWQETNGGTAVYQEEEMAILPPKPRGAFGPANSDDVAFMRSRASSDQLAEEEEQPQQQHNDHSTRESVEQHIEQRRKERFLANKAAAEENALKQGSPLILSPRGESLSASAQPLSPTSAPPPSPSPARAPSPASPPPSSPARAPSPARALPPSPRDEQQRLIRRQVSRKQRQQKNSPSSRHRTIVEEAIEFARASREAERNGGSTAAPGAHRQQREKRGASLDDQARNASQQQNGPTSHDRREREPTTMTRHQQGRNARGYGEDSTSPRTTGYGQAPAMTATATMPRGSNVSMVVTDDEEVRTDMSTSILSDEMDDGTIRINAPPNLAGDFEDGLAMNGARAISPINAAPSQNLPQHPVLQTEERPEGCYLVYFSDSGGKLILHYSRTPVPNAIGFWCAGHGKGIQGFKFRQNSGRVELIKGIAGGDANKRKFFSGWCQFVKAAVAFKGSVRKFPNVGGLEVEIYAHSPDGTTHYLSLDEEDIDVSDFDAIACIPKHNNLFNGVHALDLNRFVNTANIAGAALPL